MIQRPKAKVSAEEASSPHLLLWLSLPFQSLHSGKKWTPHITAHSVTALVSVLFVRFLISLGIPFPLSSSLYSSFKMSSLLKSWVPCLSIPLATHESLSLYWSGSFFPKYRHLQLEISYFITKQFLILQETFSPPTGYLGVCCFASTSRNSSFPLCYWSQVMCHCGQKTCLTSSKSNEPWFMV